MTSLIFDVPVINITNRSTPSAIPPWGGAPNVKALQKMPKQFFLLFGVDPEHLKHFGLQILLVYSDATAADLDTVKHDIVRLGSHFAVFAGVQKPEVLLFRAREWVMHRAPLVLRRIKSQQWKVQDPEELQIV